MRYGHFDDAQREYVIERPDTPLPWINYLGSEDYLALVSNTGGGYSFYKDARLRRLIRFRHCDTPADDGGRMLYVRDDAIEGSPSWSPTGRPIRRPLDMYKCRHGLGYTIICSSLGGIEARVPLPGPLGRLARDLRTQPHQSPAGLGAPVQSSLRSSSASGTPWMT